MSDQISVEGTIKALEDHQYKKIIKLTNENAKLRLRLGSLPEIWQYISQNLGTDLLPLIANLSASPDGNKQAQQAGIQSSLVSHCSDFAGLRPYWSALSNSCQVCPVVVTDTVHKAAIEKVSDFPNPILQFACAEARNGVRGWVGLIEAGLSLYTQWYETEQPAVDLFNNLVCIHVDNCEIIPLLGDDNLILYKVLDAVQHSSPRARPQDYYTAIYAAFQELVVKSEKLFSDRDETYWPIFILQMEILTSILENDVSAKHLLTEKGIVKVIVSLLANCKTFLPLYNKLSTAPQELEVRNFPMVKSSAIALLSQVVVNNPTAQNEVRELGGLGLVLESCVIDANNPYVKERAVICIRYLLENNQENQKFVASLEAKQVVDPAVLEKAGFEANIVDGKITLKGGKGGAV